MAVCRITLQGVVRDVSASSVLSHKSLRSPVVIIVLHISLASSSGWAGDLSCPARNSWLGCMLVTVLPSAVTLPFKEDLLGLSAFPGVLA